MSNKIICSVVLFLCISIIFNFPVFAYDVVLDTQRNYSFAGTGISYIEYDGKTFIGIKVDRLVSSVDFKNWKVIDGVSDIYYLTYLNNKFIAIGIGKTYTSSDGKTWEYNKSNLTDFYPGTPHLNSLVKNSKAIMLNTYYKGLNFEYPFYATYQSTDGIAWTKVEIFSKEPSIRLANDKFVVESIYKQGIYISDDGLNFKILKVDGSNLAYADNTYFALKEDNGKYNLYSSADLVNWSRKEIKEKGFFYPYDCNFYNINGIDYAFAPNGIQKVYKNGKWIDGELTLSYVSDSERYNICGYSLSEYGLFIWTPSYCRSWFLKDFKEYILCDYNKYSVKDPENDVAVQDGKFYLRTRVQQSNYSYANFRSYSTAFATEDGINFEEYENYPDTNRYTSDQIYSGGSNGTLHLSFGVSFPLNEPGDGGYMLGHLSENDKVQATIIYEGEKIHPLTGNNNSYWVYKGTFGNRTVQGGKGYFILNCLSNRGKTYYTRDGITRYPIMINAWYGEKAPNIRLTDKAAVFLGEYNIIHSVKLETLEAITLPKSVKVMLNDEYLSFIQAPIIENDMPFIPLNFFMECAGGKVEFDGKVANITYNKKKYAINGETGRVTADGKEISVVLKAKISKGEIIIPMSYISDIFRFKSSYDKKNEIIKITE